MTEKIDLSWPPIAAFVRQLTHDVRNQLNGLELESALLADSVTDHDGLESLARMREQLHSVAGHLRILSAKFSEPAPTLSPITASELFLIFQEQAAAIDRLPVIDWEHTLKDERVSVDATSLANAAKELLINAREFGGGERLKIGGRTDTGNVIYEISQPKTAAVKTERWGHAPFVSTRRSGYGLGLWETRRQVEANKGSITHQYKPETKELLTTLSFPIC